MKEKIEWLMENTDIKFPTENEQKQKLKACIKCEENEFNTSSPSEASSYNCENELCNMIYEDTGGSFDLARISSLPEGIQKEKSNDSTS